jgi:hypothetical protein
MSTAQTSSIVLGTTIFSFTNEWLTGRFTFDEMIEKVADLGVGPGLELVGFQSLRGFPAVSDEFAEHFAALVERLGLKPTALGGNVDLGRFSDRLMTVDETVAHVEGQIEAARKLGFPVLRIQALAGPEVLERLVPAAERAQVQVACELHSPLTPLHPEVVALRELYDRIGSPYLGFVPDFSCSMISPPEGYWLQLQHAGASSPLIAATREIWHSDATNAEKFAALAQAAQQHNVAPGMVGMLNGVMTMFGHMPVSTWREVLPYSRHIHGKFYHVDSSGNEPSIPYPQLIALLKESGYSGSISAEWEGSAFTSVEDAVEGVGFEEVQCWHAMVKRLLAN